MKNRPALLDLMLRDEAQQPAIYRPGPYWIGNQQRALAAIARDGIARFRGNAAIGKATLILFSSILLLRGLSLVGRIN